MLGVLRVRVRKGRKEEALFAPVLEAVFLPLGVLVNYFDHRQNHLLPSATPEATTGSPVCGLPCKLLCAPNRSGGRLFCLFRRLHISAPPLLSLILRRSTDVLHHLWLGQARGSLERFRISYRPKPAPSNRGNRARCLSDCLSALPGAGRV